MASSAENKESGSGKTEMVGKTFWDIVSKIFTGRPFTVILTLFAIVVLFLILTITGILKFQITDGKLSMGFKNNTISSEATENDAGMSFCIINGKALKKQIVINSVTYLVDISRYGIKKDSVIYNSRIIYNITALENITQDDNIFKEVELGKRWFGNNPETDFGHQSYYVHFDCKAGETCTLVTGSDARLKLTEMSPFVSYPNEDDVIGNLTILISSDNLDLRVESNSATRTRKIAGNRVFEIKEAFHNFSSDTEGDNHCNSLSYTWSKILPDENFEIYFSLLNR